jgi:hypothetical protein
MKMEDYKNIANRVKELDAQNNHKEEQEPVENFHGDCDYVWAPEKGTATIMYIAVLLFGSIFHARVLIWFAATIVYFKLIDKK